FSAAVSVVAGLIFGLLPAYRFSQLRLNPALQKGNRGTTGSVRSFRLGNLMVISEIALSLVLLAGAGLMLNSFVRVRMVDLGFQPEKCPDDVRLTDTETLCKQATTRYLLSAAHRTP